MRRLIVNADDLGMDRPRNRGVLAAAERGIVTSVTILANGPALTDAVAGLRQRRLDAGVHLNVSEGAPVAGPAPSLVGADGCFPGKDEARRRLAAGEVDPAALAREVAAQVDRLLEAGLTLTHADGHQHVHVYGAFLEAVAPVLRQRGVTRVRLPEEDAPTALARELASACRAWRRRLPALGLTTTDHFRGLALMGNGAPGRLQVTILGLPPGTCELMVHPGYAATGSVPFSNPSREAELAALTDPGLVAALAQAPGLERVTWGDL
jgi:predicted glycoside hydrolase/deacetylase ChbG (UPF0249 family)